ncbi:uncharacterized protein SCHCODRAFT_02641712 [Schizophyllum commune H4-8]|uniref:uncharacterized protein n=1 Tax=Schizophyllum commune (strain H4-8 / FGSC 9210) TaxID=578458 RepID=UPI00215F2EA3|nr:uncharacterized protein SCHCODRAFT_02641712 [Schizophyllum commune H4-8]KAI5886422.1 hypothetical protein SCHCODRAFT_02641712 [Schizophyllum commune H4-8]
MSEGNSPISSSDTASAWLAPKGQEIDLNGVSVQLLATRIIAMQCELEFACRERDRYRENCHQLVGERDHYLQERDQCTCERDCYKAQRDHYRAERDRYRDQRNYFRDLLKQEMGNKEAAKRAEEKLAAVGRSNGRGRGGVVGGEEIVGGREGTAPMVWEEQVLGAWAQAPVSSVRDEDEEQEDAPLDLLWDPASQALSSSVAARPASDEREDVPSASLAWEEERSAMVMGELGLFDEDDEDSEGEREDVRDKVRGPGDDNDAEEGGAPVQDAFDTSYEDDLYVDHGDDTNASERSANLHARDIDAASGASAAPLETSEADFSSYPVLDSSMYPAPGALSPPSPEVSLPPSPTASDESSFVSSAAGSSSEENREEICEEDRGGSSEEDLGGGSKDSHGGYNYKMSLQERPSTPSLRRSLPLRLRDRAGWGMRDEWEVDGDEWEADGADEAVRAQTRMDARRCVEDSLGEDYREGHGEEYPEDYAEDYAASTDDEAHPADEDPRSADDHHVPDYSLVLDGLEDCCFGAPAGGSDGINERVGPGGPSDTAKHVGLADSVGPGFHHASADDQLLSRISLSSLNLGVHCDLSEDMEADGMGMALLGMEGESRPSNANPVFFRPSADLVVSTNAGYYQSRANNRPSPTHTDASTPADASSASSGWYGADAQMLRGGRQQAEAKDRPHQANDILYQTRRSPINSTRHLVGTAQVKMADVLYQTVGDILYQTNGVQPRPADTLYRTSDVHNQAGSPRPRPELGDALYQTSNGLQSHPDLGQKMWPSGYTPENSNWFEDGYDPAEDVRVAAGEVDEAEDVCIAAEDAQHGQVDGSEEDDYNEEMDEDEDVQADEDGDVPADEDGHVQGDDDDAAGIRAEADGEAVEGFVDDLGAGDHYDDPVWENEDVIEDSAEADWDLPMSRHGCMGRAPRGSGMNRVCSTQSLWDAWDNAGDDDQGWDEEGDDKSFVTC